MGTGILQRDASIGPAEVSATLRASIVVIGDEILDGYVRDTNSGWLAGRLHGLGIPLDRVVVVPDDESAIAEALHAELGRARPRVMFTSGGIGTTPDDRTMAAVAGFLGVDLVEDPTMRTVVDGIVTRLRERGHDVDTAQQAALAKLARVPRGASPAAGPDTTTPSARIDLDGGPAADAGATLIVLPGVPGQFKDLVGRLESTLLSGRGVAACVEELTHPYPESVLTPLLEDLAERWPEVRIGSYPGPRCLLRAQGPDAAVGEVVAELRGAIDGLAADPSMRHLAERWRQGWAQAHAPGTDDQGAREL